VPGIAFVKGHGTGNDFVVLVDPDAQLDVGDRRTKALCDRRTGIGGDGVLRAVRAEHAPHGVDVTGADWFMDYRNADGSVAEMCGNGIRVFVRVLDEHGLLDAAAGDGVLIATRGGVRRVLALADGTFEADMGAATTPRLRAAPVVEVDGRRWEATGVLVPNPHAVVFVEDLSDAGELCGPPTVVPPAVFPDGVNVEFVVPYAPDHVAMRVHERGVGETLSCGTGACAVAWAWRRRDGRPESMPTSIRVDVPGGMLQVTEHDDGQLALRGPAVVVARGELDPAWWDAGGR
jgi:diaminopimelate epimerase